MLEELEETTKGKTRNARRRTSEGGPFRIIMAIVIVALLAALVMVASGLQQTRTELAELRETLRELESKPAAPAADSAAALDPEELADIQRSVRSIQSEVSSSMDQTTKEILATGRDAASDRKLLKLNLARILFEQGVSRDEIFPLIVGLDPDERDQFLDQLEETKRAGGGGTRQSEGDPDEVSISAPPVVVVPKEAPMAAEPLPLPVKQPEEQKLPEPTPAEPEDDVTTYVVKPGDTVWDISQKFGVSSSKILSANKIRDARKISIGMKLKIPKK